MLKINTFLGKMPIVAEELLPDTAAQISFNTKFYSGDLLPYRTPALVSNTGLVGSKAETIFGLPCQTPGQEDQIRWLVWDTDVDIAVASQAFAGDDCTSERFYYTGDGVPKVSTYAMATDGSPPFPIDYYELGLPLPRTVMGTAVTSVSTSNTSSYARDSGNTATIVTSSAHNLRTGNVISVTNFTDSRSSFNVTNARVTVINSTTISYFNPGDPVSTTNSTQGRVSLAGNTIPRAYVYTWMTPWAEESIPSEPTPDVYIKEGQTVTLSSIPTTKPSGKNFIRGVRVYRTIVTPAGSDYFRLATLWFPTKLAKVARQGNVATVTLEFPHNFIVDDRFKISGASDSSFNITNGVVTEVVDRNTFKFAQTAGDVTEKDETAGTLYHDVSEDLDKPARYWGDGGNFNFIDDFDGRSLSSPLASSNYDPPPKSLIGLTAMQNGILAGFTGNQVYFTEPNRPHAWPERYALSFDANIVGISNIDGYLIVMTDKGVYVISGSDPAIMTSSKVEGPYPCLSKRSIVNMPYGVVYASHAGLIFYNPSSGVDVLTKRVHHWDTWIADLDPSTLVGAFYNNKYFGSHATSSFIFEIDAEAGSFYTDIRQQFSAAWTDSRTNKFYYTAGTDGEIYEWDAPGQVFSQMEWKSKIIRPPQYFNFGAARIIADFDVPQEEIDAINAYNLSIVPFNIDQWDEHPDLGTMNGFAFNGSMINGDPYTRSRKELPDTFAVVFQLWANKQLRYQTAVKTRQIFRLPTGFKSDEFELSVSGPARVREIQLAETPTALRSV